MIDIGDVTAFCGTRLAYEMEVACADIVLLAERQRYVVRSEALA